MNSTAASGGKNNTNVSQDSEGLSAVRGLKKSGKSMGVIVMTCESQLYLLNVDVEGATLGTYQQ